MFRRMWTLFLVTAALASAATTAAAAGEPTSASPSLPVTSDAVPVAIRSDPLRAIVAEALNANLGLKQERLEERRAAAEVGEARARLLPALSLESRYSHFDGVPNVGDLVN